MDGVKTDFPCEISYILIRILLNVSNKSEIKLKLTSREAACWNLLPRAQTSKAHLRPALDRKVLKYIRLDQSIRGTISGRQFTHLTSAIPIFEEYAGAALLGCPAPKGTALEPATLFWKYNKIKTFVTVVRLWAETKGFLKRN